MPTYPSIPGLPVIFEDDCLLVVDKPTGMLSQPGRYEDGSALTRVLQSDRRLQGSVLVHRLDMDTSGLLLMAKRRDIHRQLQQQFEQRLVRKRYRAVLEQPVSELGGRIHIPIRPDIDNRPTQIVCHDSGRQSTTLWHRTPGQDARSLTFYPLTGRTHQLRVHAVARQGLGIAISGDRLYGRCARVQQNPYTLRPVPEHRLMLHADFLQFEHPQTRQQLRLHCCAPWMTADPCLE